MWYSIGLHDQWNSPFKINITENSGKCLFSYLRMYHFSFRLYLNISMARFSTFYMQLEVIWTSINIDNLEMYITKIECYALCIAFNMLLCFVENRWENMERLGLWRNATFNNISVIVWQSVLLVEETRVSGENHQPTAIHRQTLSHNVVSSTPSHEWDLNSQL